MITDWTFKAGLPGFPKHTNNAEDANDVNFDDDLKRQIFWHIQETTKITLIAI
jgi:hypothetical protein